MNDTPKKSGLAEGFVQAENAIALARNCTAELSGLPDLYIGLHGTGPRVKYIEQVLKEITTVMEEQNEQIKGLLHQEQNWLSSVRNLAMSAQDLLSDQGKLIEALCQIKNADVPAEKLRTIAREALKPFDKLLKNKSPVDKPVDELSALEWETVYNVIAYDCGGYGQNDSRDGFDSLEKAIAYAQALTPPTRDTAVIYKETKPKYVAPRPEQVWSARPSRSKPA